jgi:hypothetical protein
MSEIAFNAHRDVELVVIIFGENLYFTFVFSITFRKSCYECELLFNDTLLK